MHGQVRRLRRLTWVPVVALAAGACLATQNNVREIQADIATLRVAAQRADSVHRAEIERVARQVGAVADSLRGVNAFLLRFSTEVSRFQGDLSLTLRSFGQQLLAVQELTGQSQKKLQELRADMESNLTATAQPGASPAAAGPTALIQLAFGQLNRGSNGAARAAFQDFLDKYPTHDLVPEALFGVAQSYDYEQNLAAADSAYQAVVDRYPASDKASNALYKRALNLRKAGQTAKARALFLQLVDKYPKSPEAELAKDYLKPPG